MKVLKTTNYGKFKTIRGNRDLNVRYLTKLMESIKDHDMLEQNPIMVNDRMEVLDGQHRLRAAEIMEVPIYYLIVPTGSLREIQLLNTHQRRWTLENFLDSWIERGKEDYVYLKDFIESNGVSMATAIMLLAPVAKRDSNVDSFRQGTFKAVRKDLAKKVVGDLKQLAEFTDSSAVVTDRQFVLAVLRLLRNGVSIDKLIDKVKESHYKFIRRANVRDYVKDMEDVLSFKKKTAVRLQDK